MAKNFQKGKIIACLDIGSSKLMCLIAIINNDDIKILGYSHKESRGIVGGGISDMRLAQKSITNAVSEAERMAGLNIEKLLVNISGNQVTSTRKEESIKITSSMVKSSDISNLASKLRSQYRRDHREMIHLIPLQYRIDDSSPVINPRYMSGNKLFAKFHAISTSKTTILNIENCLKRCQLSINNYIVEPYASALACLNENEINLGNLLIDIGADITSFCLMLEGKLVYVGSIAIGGNHITKDISTILGVNFNAAEKIKNLNSSLFVSPIEEKEVIKFRMTENDAPAMYKITRLELCEIISSRLEEIFEAIKITMAKNKVPDFLVNNITLTGGVSAIVGIDKLAEDIFDKDVRIGYPTQLPDILPELDFPNYACALGMLVFSKNLLQKEKIKGGFEIKGNWFRNFIEKLVSV
ncbi:MAG TPA: cell division protein FtsA [Rickettsiales bacterium]|nr:cell division protein FtsA [Rickettsiales bacterium]